MSTGYFIHAVDRAVRLARVLGREDDIPFLVATERRSRDAFQKSFAKGRGVYGPGGQTAQALPLVFGLVPDADIPAARERLVEAVRDRDDHVDVGIQGMALVFRALSDMGRTDLAYRMLVRDSSPSPLDWVKGGETTLGDYIRADSDSRNHVMYGDYVAWAFKYLAGISPKAPGYAQVLIAPRPIPGLSFVTAATRTPAGTVRSSWRVSGRTFELELSTPPDVPTEIRLPDGSVHRTKGGERTLRCDFQQE